MALPVITSVSDCADFSKTVLPYLQQLLASRDKFDAAILADIDALKQLYITSNPVVSALVLTIASFPIFLFISEINKNYSQVDRVWSILPTVYNFHYAIWARLNGLPTQRVDHVLAFSVLWSIRLTFNYWRKGGYTIGSEDYRWEIIQKYIGQPWFFLLNLLFISTSQILILFMVATPTYVLLLTSRLQPQLTASDSTFSRALIALVVFEWFADGQMWNYQQAKKSYQATAKVPSGYTRAQMDRGFITTGLWAWSRHPNFAAEQTIWVTLYAWGCYESSTYINWTVAGAITYVLVFQGSTPLTEWITSGKYSEYKLYQRRVGKFLPFGSGWNEEEALKEAPKHASTAVDGQKGKSDGQKAKKK